jgi:isoleucyl-tRNA synthetase
LNLKAVTFVENEDELIKYDLKPNYKNLGQKYGDKVGRIVGEINKNKNDYLSQVIARKSIKLNLNGDEIILEPNDFILDEKGVGDYAVSTGNNFVVGINTAISDELKKEGIVRDLVRHVQNLRKDSGLNVEDRIEFSIESDEDIINALSNNREYFLNEVLGTNIKFNSIVQLDFISKINLDGKPATIGISQYKDKGK